MDSPFNNIYKASKYLNSSNQCQGAGSRDFLQGSGADEKLQIPEAVKPYKVGAKAGAGKNSQTMAPRSKEPGIFRAGAGIFLFQGAGIREPGLFYGCRSREPETGEKCTGSQTLLLILIYFFRITKKFLKFSLLFYLQIFMILFCK